MGRNDTDSTDRDDAREPDAHENTVRVRFTESIADGHDVLERLHETDSVVEFPSLAAAYEFNEQLQSLAEGSGREYYLTPDHTDAGETFFLRCRDPERRR